MSRGPWAGDTSAPCSPVPENRAPLAPPTPTPRSPVALQPQHTVPGACGKGTDQGQGHPVPSLPQRAEHQALAAVPAPPSWAGGRGLMITTLQDQSLGGRARSASSERMRNNTVTMT